MLVVSYLCQTAILPATLQVCLLPVEYNTVSFSFN